MLEHFRDLWRRMVGGNKDRAGAEEDRRVWVRHTSNAETVIKLASNGVDTRRQARVGNVSRGGINLIVSEQFQPGDMIGIDLPGGTPQSASVVLACVVHVRQRGEGEWALGCTFAEELNDADLAAFGARRQKPDSVEDHRSWVRFVCNVKASCQCINDGEKQAWPAAVVNISANGIGLLVDRAIETGTLLNLDLESPKHSARTILACVVHVTTRPGSEHVLGCNFIRELSEADLAALL